MKLCKFYEFGNVQGITSMGEQLGIVDGSEGDRYIDGAELKGQRREKWGSNEKNRGKKGEVGVKRR